MRSLGTLALGREREIVPDSIFPCAGIVAGRTMPAYLKGVKGSGDGWQALADAEVRRQEELNTGVRSSRGQESPYVLHHELTALMDRNVGLARTNTAIREAGPGTRSTRGTRRRGAGRPGRRHRSRSLDLILAPWRLEGVFSPHTILGEVASPEGLNAYD